MDPQNLQQAPPEVYLPPPTGYDDKFVPLALIMLPWMLTMLILAQMDLFTLNTVSKDVLVFILIASPCLLGIGFLLDYAVKSGLDKLWYRTFRYHNQRLQINYQALEEALAQINNRHRQLNGTDQRDIVWACSNLSTYLTKGYTSTGSPDYQQLIAVYDQHKDQ